MQKIITNGKGVAIDYDNVSRDTQGFSKELYIWGQTEDDDVKDGTPPFITVSIRAMH